MNPAEPRKALLPRHFYSLDALRGLAALSVVFYHWHHFFFHGAEAAPFDPRQQPLYGLFKPLYLDGWRAVDLFFCLSGFIFCWLYSDRINEYKVGLKSFFVLRFSRLYPLHLATLLFVAIGQALLVRSRGTFFVYPNNDIFHFVLQLLFASNWGLERGDSFNGPVWSVSVEVLLYIAFFITARSNFRSGWRLAVPIVSGYVLMRVGSLGVGRGVFSFFIGNLSFRIFSHLLNRGLSLGWMRGLACLTALLWIVVPINARDNSFYSFYQSLEWTDHLSWHGRDILGLILQRTRLLTYELLLFPLTIITLALWETRRGTLGRRLSFLGDISYSSYLLHFPLQLIFFGVTLVYCVPVSFFYTPTALALFFAALLPLSWLSYQFFERPWQNRIRKWAFRPGVLKD